MGSLDALSGVNIPQEPTVTDTRDEVYVREYTRSVVRTSRV